MKKIRMRHIITLVAVIGLVSFGSTAMAYRGWMNNGGGNGYFDGNRDCPGYGEGRRGGGYAAELPDEQRTQLNDARKAFFEETQALRDQLRDKADDLHEVLDAEPVDTDSAAALQTELSALKAQLDQKRLSHRIEMQKLFPDLEGGPRYKNGRGQGRRGGGGCGRW
jgi:Spy/CpxP family protein refolding chaperone